MAERVITYTYTFPEKSPTIFRIALDEETLALQTGGGGSLPDWTLLETSRCPNCRLAAVRHCPVAANLADIVARFAENFSYDAVHVVVDTPERTYAKTTSLWEGLSSLVGIVMVTSGCPGMEPLKPMVRFHLPFATLEETVFRMVSMYFVALYVRKRRGCQVELDLQGLDDIYSEVREINCAFAGRLRQAARKDANVNSLVNLHGYAEMIPLSADQMLDDLEQHFSAYLAM